jgi:hypothetical protein
LVKLSVLKLKTGETLLAETTPIPSRSDVVGVLNPFIIKFVDTDSSSTSFYAAPWVPFTDYTSFMIPIDIILLLAPLNANHRQFYGITFLKSKLYELNNIALHRISTGEDKDVVIKEMFTAMDAEYESITMKAGDLSFDIEKFKEFSLKQINDHDIQSASKFNLEDMFEERDIELDKTKIH